MWDACEAAQPRPWRRLLGDTREMQWRTLGLFVFFFLVIASFWLQKPIRTARFLSQVGPESLPIVKLGTAMLVLPVVLLYSSVAARVRRAPLVYVCTAAFAIASIAFAGLFAGGGTAADTWTSYAYFFYVDVFNSVMVALFWSFANDLTDPAAARRSYGVVGAGGIVGGAAGSALTGWGVERVGAPALLCACAVLLALMAALAGALSRGRPHRADRAADAGAAAALREAVAGARMTVMSRYLTAIALLVVGYEVVSNIIDYQFNTMATARYVGDTALAAFLGQLSTASNLASLAAQLLLTSWMLRRWGPRIGILVLPIVLSAGSGAFVLAPTFTVIAATFFSDAALGYSLNQTSKEVLYTPTDDAAKYQAKAFIDMFLMRLAKGLSSLIILGSMAFWVSGPGAVHQLSLVVLLVGTAWIAVAIGAGRRFARATGTEASQPSAATTPHAVAEPGGR